MRKRTENIITLILVIVMVIVCWVLANKPVEAGLRMIDATAYYDSYGKGIGADGQELVEGLTIAGRRQDLGKTAVLYNEDMRLIGIYEFRDVGYGQSTGKGRSTILKGMPVGTIENGTCVDIYMSSLSKCKKWGRRKVYIQIINAKG